MKQLLERLYENEHLSQAEACDLLTRITRKEFNEAQVASLLTVYRMRGIHVEELLGFRESLLAQALSIDLSAYKTLDIVGTGGDGKNTFNISTAACFVVAGAGYHVTKHGNYGASSISGASTVLERHGVKFTNESERLHRSLDGCGVAYLHAPLFHPALGAVGPLRRALGVKTFFNLLGPLVNPARPAFQLLGVANLGQIRLYTHVLKALGIGFSIVTSFDGYDEISLTSDFKVVNNSGERTFRPEDLGLRRASNAALFGGNSAEDAAKIFDDVLTNRATREQTDAVLINATFGIRSAEPSLSVETCLEKARLSLESGKAQAIFRKFLDLNS